MYDRINLNNIEISIETMLDKLRWELRSQEKRRGKEWTEEGEWNGVFRKDCS